MTAAPEVLAIRARPRPASAISAVLTLGWRAMLKIKHVPFQLFDVTVMPIMFTLLFTWIFGGALAGTPREWFSPRRLARAIRRPIPRGSAMTPMSS